MKDVVSLTKQVCHVQKCPKFKAPSKPENPPQIAETLHCPYTLPTIRQSPSILYLSWNRLNWLPTLGIPSWTTPGYAVHGEVFAEKHSIDRSWPGRSVRPFATQVQFSWS